MAEPELTPETAPSPEPTPEPTPAPAVAPATAPQSFIDGEGNFTEGWENAYLTEDQRANGRIAGGRITSIQGMLNTVINADKMISGDKMLKPSDSFGDEDWDAYHTAGGWTGEPIAITAPEGLPDGIWSDERAKTYSEGFDKLRLSPKQVAGINELHNADLVQQVTDQNNAEESSIIKLKADLLAEKGNAYAQFEHNGNFAINKGVQGDADFQQRVLDKFGGDPDFTRLMGNLGGSFSEAGSIPVNKIDATPDDIQGQLDKLRSTDAFSKPMHPEHKSTMTKIRELHIKKARVEQPV